MTPKIGDWVRLYQLGQLVIAEVRYLKPSLRGDLAAQVDDTPPKICTDIGEYFVHEILEIRPPQPGSQA